MESPAPVGARRATGAGDSIINLRSCFQSSPYAGAAARGKWAPAGRPVRASGWRLNKVELRHGGGEVTVRGTSAELI